MQRVGKASSGNLLVEVTPKEWKLLGSYFNKAEDLGLAVLEYRKKNGLKINAFAKKVGVSRNMVTKIENYGCDSLSFRTYQRVLSTILEG